MKILFKFFSILLFTLVAISNAAETTVNDVPKRFYAQAGFGLMVSKGDFNERVLVVWDKEGNKGNLHPPTLKILGSPDFVVGMNLRELTLALGFQYWNSEQKLTGYPNGAHEQDTRIMRLGLELTYNLYWPEFFQIGLGGGLSVVNVKMNDNLFFGEKTYDTDFTGVAMGLIANIRYAITDHIAMVPSLKIYENMFWTLDSDPLDDDALKSSIWQSFILVSLAVQYQF